jgi:putative spermidine/putrescine transport system permease protein
VKASALLAPPLLAFLVVYVGALAVLFVSAFWTVDSFTGKLLHVWSLDNFRLVFSTADPTYLRIAGRTIGIAAAVTATDAILAFPLGYYMARLATPRARTALFVLVLLPLWSSYLVRIYAWRLILSNDGVLNWSLGGIGLPHLHIAYTNWAMWIVFSYVWLPFMVLPVYAALELPGVVAGSIFTFSLTLGDYVTPLLVGGAGSSFIGNVVYENIGLNANVPFAAAFATVPVMIMAVYLLIARRLGAFEAL